MGVRDASKLGRQGFAIRSSLCAIILSFASAALAGGWQLLWPDPASLQLYTVVAASGRIFSGGVDSQIIRSTDDGVSWSQVEAFRASESITDFATDGARVIAIGPRGFYLSSDASGNWSVKGMPAGADYFQCVAYGSGRWVALDQDGRPYRSNDGTNWDVGGVGPGSVYSCRIAYGGGRFVLASSGGIHISFDGATWVRTLDTALLNDVAYDGTRWVAVGHYMSATSVDGVAWAVHSFPGVTGVMTAVASGNGVFVAVGAAYNSGQFGLWWSIDGTSWTQGLAPSLPAGTVFDVAFTGSRFVAVLNWGDIITSSDGSSWTVAARGSNGGLESIARDGARFVAVGRADLNSRILTSADGVQWVDRSPSSITAPEDFSKVVAHQGGFIALKRFSGSIGRSTDGEHWSISASNADGIHLNALGSNGSQVVAAGATDQIYTSSDGITWTRTRTGSASTNFVLSAVWLDSQWVLSGMFPAIITSSDGLDWAESTIVGAPGFASIAAHGGVYVGVGNDRIYRSLNLLEWVEVTPVLAHPDSCDSKVIWSGVDFVAVGSGIVCRSVDGMTWRWERFGRASYTRDIVSHAGALISIGAAIHARTVAPNVAPEATSATVVGSGPNPVVGNLTAADVDGDRLWYRVVGGPAQGMVRITNPTTGAFVFSPGASITGDVTFTFRVDDGMADSNIAVQTVRYEASSGGGGGGGGGGIAVDMLLLALLGSIARRCQVGRLDRTRQL